MQITRESPRSVRSHVTKTGQTEEKPKPYVGKGPVNAKGGKPDPSAEESGGGAKRGKEFTLSGTTEKVKANSSMGKGDS